MPLIGAHSYMTASRAHLPVYGHRHFYTYWTIALLTLDNASGFKSPLVSLQQIGAMWSFLENSVSRQVGAERGAEERLRLSFSWQWDVTRIRSASDPKQTSLNA